MSNQQGDVKSVSNARMPTANVAGNECHLAETAGGGIVQQPANRHHTGNESGGDNRNVTPTNTKRNSGAGAVKTVKTCDYCKRPFVAKRPKQARYCGPKCRRAAWLEANPDKAQAIAARDKARLKAHIIANGGAWEDRRAGGGAGRNEITFMI